MKLKFLILFILLFCGCGIDPERTYKVYNITDSSGKTYVNLNHVCCDEYIDQQGKQYIFHGNYTVISSTISGYDILRLRTEKE